MGQLDTEEAASILKKYGIQAPKYGLAKSKKEAVELGEKIGFPLALKISSKTIIHKSDVHGVKLDIKSKKELEQAYDEIINNVPKKDIEGIFVQEMVPGHYVLIGMKRDDSFGPVIAFGLGGIFVEIMKDVSFRVAPLTKKDANEMMKEIKGYKLLQGARGTSKTDFEKLADVLLKVSRIAMEMPEIQEIDFNPIIANDKHARVVDARFIVK